MNWSEVCIGQYSPGRSLLHRSDPRTKIVLTILLLATLFAVKSYPALLFLLIFSLLATLRAGKSFSRIILGLRPILWLALCAVVFNIFFIKGTPLAPSGVMSHLSHEGVDFSLRMILRLFLLVLSASLLTFTTPPLGLMAGMERLLQPLKRVGMPVHELAMMLVLALRFIPVIVEEGERIGKAQSARSAAAPRAPFRQRIHSYLPLLIPLLIGVFRRGDALATAMDARCYRGDAGRTRMRPLRLSAADLGTFFVFLVFLAVLFFVELRVIS